MGENIPLEKGQRLEPKPKMNEGRKFLRVWNDTRVSN